MESICSIDSNISYELNKTAYAPTGTKLFVFDNIHNAQKFARINIGKLFECIVKNPRQPVQVRSYYRNTYWTLINEARKRKISIKQHLYKHNIGSGQYWPKGTIWCDSVTLTKQIE